MNDRLIDVRSDTVTRPTPAMRSAMAEACVGDDVYGDDPTVNRLQAMTAERLGHEAALFMPSGTQSNLVALLTHCARGDEYIVGADAHTYKYEGGGAAALGGIQPQTLPFDDDGGLSVDEVSLLVKEDDPHFARTRLVCIENSQHGRVQSLASMHAMQTFTAEAGLGLHLDGARMANAAVALGVSLEAMGSLCDTVSLCLSKGLGAPLGSMLVGDSSFIDAARRWRKVTGGGLRQAGIVAAAGILALDEGVERLQEDHDKAAWLGDKLEGIEGLHVRRAWICTNMVWLDYDDGIGDTLAAAAKSRGVLMSAGRNVGRVVLHRDVTQPEVEHVATTIIDHCRTFAKTDQETG